MQLGNSSYTLVANTCICTNRTLNEHVRLADTIEQSAFPQAGDAGRQSITKLSGARVKSTALVVCEG